MNYQALKTEMALPAYNGMTDAQILAALNAKTVAAPQKALLRPTDILNAVVPADLAALPSGAVAMLTLVLQGTLVDASPGTTIRAAVQTIFAGKAQTLANLGALVSPYDNGTTAWAPSALGVPAGTVLTEPDLEMARAS